MASLPLRLTGAALIGLFLSAMAATAHVNPTAPLFAPTMPVDRPAAPLPPVNLSFGPAAIG